MKTYDGIISSEIWLHVFAVHGDKRTFVAHGITRLKTRRLEKVP